MTPSAPVLLAACLAAFSLPPQASADIKCHSCGILGLCDLPYEIFDEEDEELEREAEEVVEEAERYLQAYEPDPNAPTVRARRNSFILCKDTCYKFDGWSDDGFRVIIRDCHVIENAVVETNTCKEDIEHHGATGTYCACNGEKCNGAPGGIAPPSAFRLTAAVVAVLASALAVGAI